MSQTSRGFSKGLQVILAATKAIHIKFMYQDLEDCLSKHGENWSKSLTQDLRVLADI